MPRDGVGAHAEALGSTATNHVMDARFGPAGPLAGPVAITFTWLDEEQNPPAPPAKGNGTVDGTGISETSLKIVPQRADVAALQPGQVTILRGQPALEPYVIGHTDNQGTGGYDVPLSERRAAAVVQRLAGTYGIDGGRLTPAGVGPYAPVASNRTDDGRAKNRRVELVER